MKSPPKSARLLTKLVDQYARANGVAPPRVRNWVSFMVIAGALERAGFVGEGPRFTVKGGVALELRLRSAARATRDLDLVLTGPFEPLDRLAIAFAEPYQNFGFRLKREPHTMPNEAVRVEVALSYLGKPWGSVQVDVSPPELEGVRVELIDAVELTEFGLQGPSAVPCLSLACHIAQKLHAVSRPALPEWRNDRFRDLVDLLLLRDLVTDHAEVRRACEEVFAVRRTHPWPPLLEAPEEWAAPFARLARDTGLPVEDLHQAVLELRGFVCAIDATAPLFPGIQRPPGLTATTWYYAVSADERVVRLPFAVGDALLKGEPVPGGLIKQSWEREPGGIALIGVVVWLHQRRPLFIERVATRAIATAAGVKGRTVAYGPPIWDSLARELIARAAAPLRAVAALGGFLSKMPGDLPGQVARLTGDSTAGMHVLWTRLGDDEPQVVWDLHASSPVEFAPSRRP